MQQHILYWPKVWLSASFLHLSCIVFARWWLLLLPLSVKTHFFKPFLSFWISFTSCTYVDIYAIPILSWLLSPRQHISLNKNYSCLRYQATGRARTTSIFLHCWGRALEHLGHKRRIAGCRINFTKPAISSSPGPSSPAPERSQAWGSGEHEAPSWLELSCSSSAPNKR